jgi:hypothetical protein
MEICVGESPDDAMYWAELVNMWFHKLKFLK